MTIVSSSSAKLFTVVGSTGMQGRSVITALEASKQQYRVRAVTRDATKPAAKELESIGCEVVEADTNSRASLENAFKGADIVFAMTLTIFEENGKAMEYQQGINQMDAAKAQDVKIVAWSGLPHITKVSGGKLAPDMIDVKAEVADYARSIDGLKLIDIQPGSYLTNYLQFSMPRKQDDGSYTLALPYGPEDLIPVVDIRRDYGNYVVGAVENGGPETVYAAPAYVTPVQMAAAFAKASGKSVTPAFLPDTVIFEIVKNVMGKWAAEMLAGMYHSHRAYGYFLGNSLEESNRILSAPAATFEEALIENKDAVDRIFA